MEDTQNTGSSTANPVWRARPTIGFIIPEVRTQVPLQIWAGVVDAARALDINLIGFSGYELQRPDAFRAQGNVIYDLISAENVDGLGLWTNSLSNYTGPEATQKLYERFPAVPMVDLEVTTPVAESYSYRAMQSIIRHLIDAHGSHRIAFIRGPIGHQEAENRYHAYCDILQMEKLAADQARVVLADDWSELSGKKAIRILLEERHATFDAIVAANDFLAMGAIQELQNRGIRVPQDVVVTGFDDVIGSRYCTPPLTTVRYPLYDMGWQTIEAVAAEISGEPVERRSFPVQLRIRYSCGCLSQIVLQTPVGETTVLDEPFEAAFAARRQAVLDEMQRMCEDIGITSEWIERLVEMFVSEIRDACQGEFIALLNDVLEQTIKTGGEVAEWQGIMSAFYHQFLPCLENRRHLVQAEDLWQQARVLIGEVTTRAKMAQSSERERQSYILFEITDRLVTTFDVEQLMDILAEDLPRLNIPSCYLSLYEDPQSPTEMARLMLAYTDQGRAALAETGQRFPAKHLVPDQFLPQDRQYALLLRALYFREQQIGFVLFEVSPDWKDVYETVCGLISSALQGALLVRQVQERSAEIARQKYILDTFMANVPDSIYFKDRESRFLRVNHALAVLFHTNDPADLIGKSDFDYFPEEQAHTKYEEEQTIIRTGQPILNYEESDAGGRWALTTKMPLRDEHGNIIGTFGISRDITALKHAQQELAVAYEEIRIMNDQLQEENLRMGAELNVARRLQEMVLPTSEELQQIQGLDIVGYMKPADEVGGDYYDILPKHGVLHIGIGDVTGHGLESGVLMLMTQASIRTLIEHGETDPVKFVSTLNRTIYKNVQRMGADKTLTFALINYADGQLKIVGQHEELLVVRKGGKIERVDTLNLGFPIGLEEEIAEWVATATFSLQSGDGVVLYTDGITEAANLHNELYGLECLCEVVSRHWDKSVNEIKQAVIDNVIAHIGKQKIYDDLTLVVLKQR